MRLASVIGPFEDQRREFGPGRSKCAAAQPAGPLPMITTLSVAKQNFLCGLVAVRIGTRVPRQRAVPGFPRG